MSNIVKNYFRVLEVISSLNVDFNDSFRVGRKPKMTDIEVVALSLTAEFMSIDSENALFHHFDISQISNLIERSQYNKRRKKLFIFSEMVRRALAKNLKIVLLWIACHWKFVKGLEKIG